MKWLAAVAMAVILAGGAGVGPAWAESTPAEAKKAPERPVFAGTLSGAFLAARTAEDDNDLDEAVKMYRRALDFDPENATLQQSLMLALIADGRFDDSLEMAAKLKTVAEAERYSRIALGIDAIRSRQYRAAEPLFVLADASDLDRLIAGILTGWAKAGDGKTKEAVDYVEKLEGPSWFQMFKTYHEALMADTGGEARAGELYKKVIDDRASAGAAPDTWFRAVDAYASWLARNGKGGEAIAALVAADEVAPDRPGSEAIKKLIDAGRPVPPLVADVPKGAAELMLNMATALNRGGGESFVRLYLQMGRALDPQDDQILVQLGALAEKMNQAEKAIQYYGEVPKDSPYRRVAELQLGLNLADVDRFDESVGHLRSAIDSEPGDMRGYLALAGVYASKEDHANAAKVLDEAVAHLPVAREEDWNLFYRRGIAYERLKEWDKAEPSFRRALELYPDQPQVLNYLGYSWVDMNINLDEGLEMIKKAVELRPDDGYIVDSLGWAYYRLGRFDDAVKELERAVQLKPEDPTINDHLGDAYWRAGRKLEATFQWAHARDLKAEPELMAVVEKKLKEGLPDADPKETVADPAKAGGKS